MLDFTIIDPIIKRALAEDLGTIGDLTTQAIIDKGMGEGKILARASGVLAGLPVARRVFEKVDPRTIFETRFQDGDRVAQEDTIAVVKGPLPGLLTAERTVLNFLQRLSGIATLTAQFVAAVSGTKARITDTRKTTPNLRYLEKYAVRMGGGENHRFGLYDMILIKDNHIQAAGGLKAAVDRVNQFLKGSEKVKVEIEVDNLEDVQEAIGLAVDRIMLDNFSPSRIKQAVSIIGGQLEVEASGGITLKTVREVAECGVDYISVGALTHSAPALDMSLELT